MTSYERGFMSKCAELGIDPRTAGFMLKVAIQVDENSSITGPDGRKYYAAIDSQPLTEGQKMDDFMEAPKDDIPKYLTDPVKQPEPDPVKPPTSPTPPPPQGAQTAKERFSTLTPDQQSAYRKWQNSNGMGGAFQAMFKDSTGKVNMDAFEKFMADDPDFMTGTDQYRNDKIKSYIAAMSDADRKRLGSDPAVMAFQRNLRKSNMQPVTITRTYGGTPRSNTKVGPNSIVRNGGRASFRPDGIDFSIKDSDRTLAGAGNMNGWN